MLIFLFVLVAVAGALQYWSLLHGLDGVEHACMPGQHLAEPGEPFPLVTRITNRSRRFIPYLQVRQLLPPDLTFQPDIRLESAQNNCVRRFSTYLAPRQVLQQEMQAVLPRRGRHLFPGATLYGGGFLGLNETTENTTQHQEIIVLPAPWPGTALPATLGGFLGDQSVNRFLMEDPVLTLGFRDYTGREPMKSISWTQSARKGALMVKNYDYTLELTATVLLNIGTAHDDGWEDRLEHCFSLARTVCEELDRQKMPYRLMTNANIIGGINLWSHAEDGMGNAHLSAILEGLGRASYNCLYPCEALLDRAARTAQHGRTHILITPGRDAHWQPALSRLEQLSGSKVLVLVPEEEDAQ